MELGLPVLQLDADLGRVLAAGRGRFAVWGEAELPPATGQCGQDATVRLAGKEVFIGDHILQLGQLQRLRSACPTRLATSRSHSSAF